MRAFTSRRLAGVDNPEPWLRTTALNAARSRWRRLRRLEVLLDIGRETRPVDVCVHGVSTERVALIAALRTLPDRQREAVVRHHIADQPVTEVAAALGVPVGTVKVALLLDERGHRRLPQPADEIVDRALALRDISSRPDVYIARSDTGMQLRARALGLPVIDLTTP